MEEIFSPTNLVLAGIVAVIFWRLWSVLGTRTGNERTPMDVPSPLPDATRERPSARGSETIDVAHPARPAKPVWADVASEGSELAAALEKIGAASPGFDAKHFVAGARSAYEMVVEAFGSGDKATLKPLLAPDVLDGFTKAIDARNASKQKLDYRFIGFDKSEVQRAELDGKRAIIDMKFVSQFISATYDAAGNLIDGDPNSVRSVTDLWSFERDVSQSNPNWRVISTESLG